MNLSKKRDFYKNVYQIHIAKTHMNILYYIFKYFYLSRYTTPNIDII